MLQIYNRKTLKGKIKSPEARAAEQRGCLTLEPALDARLVGDAITILSGCAVPQAAGGTF